MIRILQCVNDMHRAGLETMLMNYYRNIDRDKIQFDFLTHRPYKSDYDEEIVSLGGRVFYAPRLYPQNYIAYFKWMKAFFNEQSEYQIVHSHMDSMSYLPLLAAKKAEIPIRIAHSHNTSIDRDFKYVLKQYFRWKINSVANYRFACGNAAGQYLFRNRDFVVIPNAVDSQKFLYNKLIRAIKRQELGVEGKFVIGHVGRLSYQKNHKFLIDIFRNIANIERNAVLILVGTGNKEQKICSQINQYGLNDRIYLLGNRSDVNELYQAMDVFVMPSFFEGVPLVGIEAQFSELPCIFSTEIPNEVAFSDNVCFVELRASINKWTNKILKYRNYYRNRGVAYSKIRTSIYEISNSVGRLSNLYLNIHKSLEW